MRRLSLMLLIVACADEPAMLEDGGRTRPDVGLEEPDAGEPLQACTPPLAFSETSATVLPLDLYTATATGGTGAYRFRLSSDQSGGRINALTGAYLSGERGGTEDQLEVTDVGCLGAAMMTVRVVDPLDVRPRDVEGPPSISFRFQVTGGSGSFRFSRVLDGTGGSLDATTGDYRAGANAGTDVVRVEDVETGETRDATIRVIAGAALRPTPSRVYFPVGARFRLRITGGSGFFDVVSDNAAVGYEDGELIGMSPGRANLAVTDTFTRQTTMLRADSIGPGDFEQRRSGEALGSAQALGAGDLDGDGNQDALLALSEADIGYVNSGAVFVYAGDGSGLNPTPARVIGGSDRDEELGRRIALADLDGDGRNDLIAGLMRADVRQTDSGAVSVYRGVAGAFFEEEPSTSISGRFAYDYFGWAVTACDFNGDGTLDLAAGAPYTEDGDRAPIMYDQGAVFIHLGYSDGFRDDADQVLYGEVLQDDGSFAAQAYLHFGMTLASGDLDGDGACELIAAAPEFTRVAPLDGLVYIYKGRAPEMGNNGGVYARPVRAIANSEAHDDYNGFARRIAIGDLDGDQRAELAIAHGTFDSDGPGGSDNYGAVRVWRGGPLEATPAATITPISAADWSWIGSEPWEQFGIELEIADADGDLQPDLVISIGYDEVTPVMPPNAYDTGVVRVFPGQTGMMPSMTPSLGFGASQSAYSRFGAAAGVVGDTDGDRRPDLIAFADYDNRHGIYAGAPYFISSTTPAASVALDFPGEPSGSRAGAGIDIAGDVDGDGFDDLIVGAQTYDHPTGGLDIGAAFLHRGTASGFERSPSRTFQFFRGNVNYDHLGFDVSRAGDFDGDGRADFALLGLYADLPSPLPAGVTGDATCAARGSSYDTGAAFLFKGSAGLPDSEPSFILYGPQNIAFDVAGGFDFDNDGLDDIALSSPYWDRSGLNDTGGVAIYRGRNAVPGQTLAVCAPDFLLLGRAASDLFGWSVAAIGDVDGDGCDELAAGAWNETINAPAQGTARVIFGAGPSCASTSPRAVTFASTLAYSQAGWSVAGGEDLTGDGYPDLIVGVPNFYNATGVPGSIVLVTSELIRAATKEVFVDGAVPAAVESLPQRNEARRIQLFGSVTGERFGESVALVRTDRGPAIAVGSPYGDASGVPLSGGVGIYLFDAAGGLSTSPDDLFGGETERPGGLFGSRISAAISGGRGLIATGAPLASGVGLDQGAGYVIDLRP